jgi:hypothetical protein
MKRWLAKVVLPLLFVPACLDNNGDSLTVTTALPVTPPLCVFDPQATTFISEGVRDVSAAPFGAHGYIIGLRIVNNMLAATASPVKFGNITNVYVNENDVTVDGVNVCYELKDFRNTTESATAGAPPPENTFPSCKSISDRERTSFLPSTATVGAGAGVGSISLDILPPSLTNADVATPFNQSSSRFLQGLQNVGDRKTIIVHLQAVGHTNDNRRIESNEFLFPVQLCVGCVPFQAACSMGKIPDPTTFCVAGQDKVPTCVTPM